MLPTCLGAEKCISAFSFIQPAGSALGRVSQCTHRLRWCVSLQRHVWLDVSTLLSAAFHTCTPPSTYAPGINTCMHVCAAVSQHAGSPARRPTHPTANTTPPPATTTNHPSTGSAAASDSATPISPISLYHTRHASGQRTITGADVRLFPISCHLLASHSTSAHTTGHSTVFRHTISTYRSRPHTACPAYGHTAAAAAAAAAGRPFNHLLVRAGSSSMHASGRVQRLARAAVSAAALGRCCCRCL